MKRGKSGAESGDKTRKISSFFAPKASTPSQAQKTQPPSNSPAAPITTLPNKETSAFKRSKVDDDHDQVIDLADSDLSQDAPNLSLFITTTRKHNVQAKLTSPAETLPATTTTTHTLTHERQTLAKQVLCRPSRAQNVADAAVAAAAAAAEAGNSAELAWHGIADRHGEYVSQADRGGTSNTPARIQISNPKSPSTLAAGKKSGSAEVSASGVKYTPLECQVVELKRKHPDTVLVVEVGYKFRFFGEDAALACRLCPIYSHQDHAFLAASFPVHRLMVYVRRLCDAGHKVGVVRQVETAALKSVGSNKSAPFDRRVTALYTAATLDANLRADKLGEEGGVLDEAADQTTEGGAGGGRGKARYILCIAEDESNQHRDKDSDSSPTAKATAPAAAAAASACTDVGVVVVEPSTGEVMIGVCRSSPLQASPLEGLLLSMRPSEMVSDSAPSHATAALLRTFLAACPTCRLEGGLRPGWEDRSVQEEPGEGRGVPQAEVEEILHTIYSGTASAASDLTSVMSLPALVKRALAVAHSHLGSYGLQRVLLQPNAFRPLSTTTEMSLSANALKQLEILDAGGDDSSRSQGSLFHLMDRTSTGFGSRLLRHWISHPLTQIQMIQRRQEAVAELVGTTEGPLSHLPRLLRKCPDLARTITRATHRTALPSEFVAMMHVLAQIPTKLLLQVSAPICNGGDVDELGITKELNSETREDVIMGEPGEWATAGMSSSGSRSQLLHSLLADLSSPQLHRCVGQLLGMFHRPAALANQYVEMWAAEDGCASGVAAAKQAVTEAEQQIQSLLPQLARQLDVRKLEYVTVQNQGTYLIEVSVELEKRVPKSWIKVCSTKKVHRYHPPEVSASSLTLSCCKERLAAEATSSWADFLVSFAPHAPLCRAAVDALAQLDALSSLAELARTPGYCQPVFTATAAATPLHASQQLQGALTHTPMDSDTPHGKGIKRPAAAAAVSVDKVSSGQVTLQTDGLMQRPNKAAISGVNREAYDLDNSMTAQAIAINDHFANFKGPFSMTAAEAESFSAQVAAYAISGDCDWESFPRTQVQGAYATFAFPPAATSPAPTEATAAASAAAATAAAAAAAVVATTVAAASAAAAATAATAASPAATAGVNIGACIEAVDARHPMLDHQLGGCAVPNNIRLSWGGQRGLVITGPNMGGKSCYSRTAALLVIMAQAGSFVPASSLTLSVFDCVFTRMGGSDNLMSGRSTFMEELGDAGDILAHATPASLVIMDELGRGTATHDGVAIATATLHWLLLNVQCLTLFITHYPEVAAASYPGAMLGVSHLSYVREDTLVEVGQENGETNTETRASAPSVETGIAATGVRSAYSQGQGKGQTVVVPRLTFLYKLVVGAADQSFGLNVAAMAGLPASVVGRAAEKAQDMITLVEGGPAPQQQVPDVFATLDTSSLKLAETAVTIVQHLRQHRLTGNLLNAEVTQEGSGLSLHGDTQMSTDVMSMKDLQLLARTSLGQ